MAKKQSKTEYHIMVTTEKGWVTLLKTRYLDLNIVADCLAKEAAEMSKEAAMEETKPAKTKLKR
jgi:hypothetical protein